MKMKSMGRCDMKITENVERGLSTWVLTSGFLPVLPESLSQLSLGRVEVSVKQWYSQVGHYSWISMLRRWVWYWELTKWCANTY